MSEHLPHVSAAERVPAIAPGWKPSDPVVAPLTYLVDNGEKPAVHMAPPGGGTPRRTAEAAVHSLPIYDARPLAPELSLDREGFEVLAHDTAVSDFYDDEEVRAVYYPEMERLVKQATGATRVLVFDHTTRADPGAVGAAKSLRLPVRRVHNDYTPRSGPQRVRDLLAPEDAEAMLQRPYAVINVWRPIEGPVLTAPLAVADARSIAPADLVATDLVYRDRTGEIYEVAFNPSHRWHYVPRMERHETLLIKGYDSREDGRARFTPHTAFDDPAAPPDAPARESIEIRTLAFFGPEADHAG
jgi:hypothetical protein